MNIRLTAYLFSLITLFPLLCSAQEGRQLTVDNELSSSLINYLYEDKEGIIWIATENGLNRYDGAKFTALHHETNNPNSLMSNYTRTVFEDSQGRFFVGTLNGLQCYDRSTRCFTKVPLLFRDGRTVQAHVSSVVERKNGELLISTCGHGVFRAEYRQDTLTMVQDPFLFPSFQIDGLHEDSQGSLWAMSANQGLLCIASDGHLEQYTPRSGIVQPSCLYEDERGNFYVGCLQNGLFRYRRSSNTFEHIECPGTPHLPVKSISAINDRELYIGTDGKGVKRYNLSTRTIEDEDIGNARFDFSKAKVHAILKDGQGNIWLGLFQKGVLIEPAVTNGFHYIGYKSPRFDLIGSSCVMSVCKTDNGTLWVGTDNDGLYAIPHDRSQQTHYAPRQTDVSPIPATIMSLYEASDHQLYIGSYFDGLFRMDPRTGHSERVVFYDKFVDFKEQGINAMTEDREGRLWIGTHGMGLFGLNLRTGQSFRAPTLESGLNYRPDLDILHNTWINSLLVSSDHKLYIGTFDGLGCLDLESLSFTEAFGGTNRQIDSEVIYALYEDNEGLIWMGTEQGLRCFNPKDKSTQLYTVNDGLPGNSISSIEGDTGDNLWIGTNAGLSRYDKRTQTFANFHVSDGLQGDEFTRGASCVGLNEDLVFGGTGGVTIFRPTEISFHHNVPRIRITDFYLHDKPVTKNMKSGRYTIIDSDVSQADHFHLSYKDNSFSIEFSAMEYYNPSRISYHYSFLNSSWIALTPGVNRATFSNLTPGTYRFSVYAKDYDAVSEKRTITILISPPWYASWWAKLCYFLVACGIIFLLVREAHQRYQARQQMLDHIRAEELNEAKLQFFINIAHEIRTPMSLVISPLQKLIENDADEDRQRSYLTIQRSAERILGLVNQLMDLRKIDKGQMRLQFHRTELVSFLKDLFLTFDDQARRRHIVFEFEPTMESLYAWIDPKNFDKVIINLLSNAFKFTPEYGTVRILLQTGADRHAEPACLKQYVEIIVEDTGIGIAPEELERIFERFYQSESGRTLSGIGTGVGLHLTRSLVELHHGTIHAINNAGRSGCSFIVHIPLGKEHLTNEELPRQTKSKTPPRTPFDNETTPAKQHAVNSVPVRLHYTVMVVEDEEDIRRYVSYELGKNFRIVECQDGKEALTEILKTTPDLVVSDVMMPVMDGMTLCKKIKQNIHINQVPVILLTALSSERDNIEGLQVGADAYIAKPFNIEILRNTVFNLIRMRELLKNNYSGNQDVVNVPSPATPTNSNDEKLLERVVNCINDNLSNPELSVEMIATTVGISRTHLHRKLKELTNQSTRDFIRNIRLKQAAILLNDRGLTVTEVARITGFGSTSYFSTAFKDLYGTTPYAYNKPKDNGEPDGTDAPQAPPSA